MTPPPFDPQAEYGPDVPPPSAPARRALGSPELAPDRIPPERPEWLRNFILRVDEKVLDPASSAAQRDGRLELWDRMVAGMVKVGVASAILKILEDVADPDGKDERRGWTFDAV